MIQYKVILYCTILYYIIDHSTLVYGASSFHVLDFMAAGHRQE